MKLYLSRYALVHNKVLNYGWPIALVTPKEILANNKQKFINS